MKEIGIVRNMRAQKGGCLQSITGIVRNSETKNNAVLGDSMSVKIPIGSSRNWLIFWMEQFAPSNQCQLLYDMGKRRKQISALLSTHPIGDTTDSVPLLLFANTFAPTASDTTS